MPIPVDNPHNFAEGFKNPWKSHKFLHSQRLITRTETLTRPKKKRSMDASVHVGGKYEKYETQYGKSLIFLLWIDFDME